MDTSTHTLHLTLPAGLWGEFKQVAHAQGVTYHSLAVGCIQAQLWPHMGAPVLEPFGEKETQGQGTGNSVKGAQRGRQ
jgi:hypothetical protein